MATQHSKKQSKNNVMNIMSNMGRKQIAQIHPKAQTPRRPELRHMAERLIRRLKAEPLWPPPQLKTNYKKKSSPPLASIVFHKLAFGPTPEDVEAFQALGDTDEERLQAWVDQQLNPDSIPDTELDARIAASNFTTLNKSLPQLWADHWLPQDITWEVRFRPFMETWALTLLRAVYSKKQLLEVLTSFWRDHFNVYGWHGDVGPVLVHYDRDVIRPHVLGNFRDFLEAVASSTAMLFYLDNVFSTQEGPNENYARELMELHTLGAMHYMGAIPASEVPVDAEGIPVAYVDEDVREMARCLTGWSVNERTGEFLYREEWHDPGPKRVLGLEIPAGLPPLEDVRRVLDRLATHPGTARFICTKLCRRLVADNPPQSLVDRAAATFLANTSAPDQLAKVVRTIILSAEFLSSWGEKVKRPFEMIASAMRAMNPDFTMDLTEELTWWIFWMIAETGHEPFGWRPPTGYPDTRSSWLGTNPIVMTWRAINWLSGLTYPPDSETYPFDVVAATPEELTTAEEITDYWIERCLARPIDPNDREKMVDFMAQGHQPNIDLPHGNEEELWKLHQRTRTLAALILTSPEAWLR